MHIHLSFFWQLMHIYAIRPVCTHHGVCIESLIVILRRNAYTCIHQQITEEFEGGNTCMSVRFWLCKPVVKSLLLESVMCESELRIRIQAP